MKRLATLWSRVPLVIPPTLYFRPFFFRLRVSHCSRSSSVKAGKPKRAETNTGPTTVPASGRRTKILECIKINEHEMSLRAQNWDYSRLIRGRVTLAYMEIPRWTLSTLKSCTAPKKKTVVFLPSFITLSVATVENQPQILLPEKL